MYGFVEGFVEEDSIKEYEQQEVYETTTQLPPIKNETTDGVEIKMEQADTTEDYSMFISTEYLETLQDQDDDEEEGGIDEGNYVEEEEFAFVKQEKRSGHVRLKGSKKHYKRFELSSFKKTIEISFCFSFFQSSLRVVWEFVLQRSASATH